MMVAERLVGRVNLQMENRGDTFYVSSSDLPGLFLWGKDVDAVLGKVKPTIRELFRLNRELDVSVQETPAERQRGWSGLEHAARSFEVYAVHRGVQPTRHG